MGSNCLIFVLMVKVLISGGCLGWGRREREWHPFLTPGGGCLKPLNYRSGSKQSDGGGGLVLTKNDGQLLAWKEACAAAFPQDSMCRKNPVTHLQ